MSTKKKAIKGTPSNISNNERKRVFSPQSTKDLTSVLKQTIKDRRIKKETISVIKAIDLKKIKNTSET